MLATKIGGFRNSIKKSKSRKNRRRRFTIIDSLESRQLLAGDLIAHWSADQLNDDIADGAPISEWIDTVRGTPAKAVGAPTLIHGALGGRSVVGFAPEDGADSFNIKIQDNPMLSAGDFSVSALFVTDSTNLVGGSDEWFKNSGLVDSNELGFSTDWGMSINHAGQVSIGMGEALFQPSATIYSNESGLNNGDSHLAVLSRQGGNLKLYIDGQLSSETSNASTLARKDWIGLSIGALNGEKNPFDGAIADVRLFNGALDAQESFRICISKFPATTIMASRPLATTFIRSMKIRSSYFTWNLPQPECFQMTPIPKMIR